VLIIDPRMGSKSLLAPLRADGAPAEFGPLEFGDAYFVGAGPGGAPVTVGVEYKKLLDLLACMTSGRYAGHQLVGMREDYDVQWLLVEGIWRPRADGVVEIYGFRGWEPLRIGGRCYLQRDLDSYLLSLTQQGGTRIWKTSTPVESARWLHTLYRWWQRDWDEHASLQTFDLSGPVAGLSEPPFTRRVAKELPGIGWKKSLVVTDAFDSVAAMVAADERTWRRVPGIGKTLAPRIVRALHVGE
jgi:ERCC4-type nuclease